MLILFLVNSVVDSEIDKSSNSKPTKDPAADPGIVQLIPVNTSALVHQQFMEGKDLAPQMFEFSDL
jgi:hypothetical protein